MAHTVLVTGANRGIGLEFAKQYCNDGWNVIATCRSPATATELNSLAEQANDQITVLPLDSEDISQIEKLASTVGEVNIDVLINNAGVYGEQASTLGQLHADAWLKTFLVNTIAPLKIMESLTAHVSRSTLKTMAVLSSKMGSIADNTSGSQYAYRSSKAGLNAALKSAAIDLRSKNINVVSLHPGWLKTDMGGKNAIHSVDEHVSKLRAVIAKLSVENSGQFLNYNGIELPW